MINLAILASGSGSNAEAIIRYFKDHETIKVVLILSNNSNAGVLNRAKEHNVKSIVVNSEQTKQGVLFNELKNNHIDYIILAGYMKLVPKQIIEAFPKRILNIHPALLPKFGGKGMYGMNVHQAVVQAQEKESGMTIHYVSEHYDEGAIIFQEAVSLSDSDTPEEVAKKVLKLEHKNYPRVIEEVVNGKH
ncbi:MAG: phosphoribosylglycinamide formyltransferase [Schleiferiaceae bacterium]|jgi:phosphoribosylglycinamide formyltransferase-1|nr:phosphoribosylglycinamide formyltransferase [Schleiferiaceae bacterium]